jgi:cytochrome c-type biogenesis protein CcmH/NrfG
MRNGTTSNGNKLVLVNSSGRPVHGQDLVDDAAVDYQSEPDTEPSSSAEDVQKTRVTLLVFMAVSIACTTAAIATGSYAVWLSRQQAARQALTDVNDILRSCQSRMQQLEADIQRLPGREA